MDPSPSYLSPFHASERAAQALAGVTTNGAGIRDFMPDQHRSFFESLPNLFVGVRGHDGWPLATMLSGAPGFIRSPDNTTLRVEALPDAADPVADTFAVTDEIGLLGIDFATRRRNRVNGLIVARGAAGFSVEVAQSFGNCPQYIQRRAIRSVPHVPQKAEPLAGLDASARRLIANADTFFIASAAGRDSGKAGGSDISHRGGKPGFVRLDADTLTIPDFRGNNYFNTFGNLLSDPRAALLFINFETADLLQLQGKAEIDWRTEDAQKVVGAQRNWRFHVMRGWRRRAASPLRWSFVDYSPFTLRTGVWQDVLGARSPATAPAPEIAN